jgi:hypothetical protein
MECFSLNEQVAQETAPLAVRKAKKKRSQVEKYGRFRWILILLGRMDARLDRIEAMQDVILNGLEGAGYFKFTVPLIQKVAVKDQVDLEILHRVFEAGREGVFPKDVAAGLTQYGLAYYDVSRRIVRMNKRLFAKTRERLFEKRGHKWALTSFGFESWGKINNQDINQ